MVSAYQPRYTVIRGLSRFAQLVRAFFFPATTLVDQVFSAMTPDVENIRWRHRIIERLQNHEAPKVFRLCLFDGKAILYSATPLDLPDGNSGNVCDRFWRYIFPCLISVTSTNLSFLEKAKFQLG
jgi:hypothetical protein